MAKLEGHTGEVFSLAWRSDGEALATASQDKTIRIWNPATGRETTKLEGPSEVYSVAWPQMARS